MSILVYVALGIVALHVVGTHSDAFRLHFSPQPFLLAHDILANHLPSIVHEVSWPHTIRATIHLRSVHNNCPSTLFFSPNRMGIKTHGCNHAHHHAGAECNHCGPDMKLDQP